MYVVATRITFICPMKFNAFPMDIQVCMFQVGPRALLLGIGDSEVTKII